MNTLRSYTSLLVRTFRSKLQNFSGKSSPDFCQTSQKMTDVIVTNFWIFRHHGFAVADGISQYSAGDPASSQWQCTSHRYLPPPPLSILHFFFLYFRVFLSFYSMGGVYMYELCLCCTCPEVLLYNISTMCTLYNIYASSKFVPIHYT